MTTLVLSFDHTKFYQNLNYCNWFFPLHLTSIQNCLGNVAKYPFSIFSIHTENTYLVFYKLPAMLLYSSILKSMFSCTYSPLSIQFWLLHHLIVTSAPRGDVQSTGIPHLPPTMPLLFQPFVWLLMPTKSWYWWPCTEHAAGFVIVHFKQVFRCWWSKSQFIIYL